MATDAFSQNIHSPGSTIRSGAMNRRWNDTARAFHGARAVHAAILSLVVGAIACGRVDEQKQNAAGGAAFPFDNRIGWVHGSCLAISNADLAGGTPVA